MSLWSHQILETEENRTAFLKIVEIARSVFKVPTALISLVDREQQWFLAESGLGCNSTGRDVSFCGHAILNTHGKVLEVLDATKDWRFKGNPLVTGPPYIRFYAGMPLTIKVLKDDTSENCNINIGTICLIDGQPHDSFPDELREKLKSFSRIIVSLMESWKRERTMFLENNLQMTILKGLQSTILSKTLQPSIAIFLETITEVLQVSALILTRKNEISGTADVYCGKGVTDWNEPWTLGYISYETMNSQRKEMLVQGENAVLIPNKEFYTLASVVVNHQNSDFGVLIVLSKEEKKPITESYLKILKSISQTISFLIGKHAYLETIELQKSKELKTKEEIRSVNERLYVTKKILSAVNDGIKNPLQGINDSLSITNECNNDCQNTNKIIANCTRALFSAVNNLIEAKHLLSPGSIIIVCTLF